MDRTIELGGRTQIGIRCRIITISAAGLRTIKKHLPNSESFVLYLCRYGMSSDCTFDVQNLIWQAKRQESEGGRSRMKLQISHTSSRVKELTRAPVATVQNLAPDDAIDADGIVRLWDILASFLAASLLGSRVEKNAAHANLKRQVSARTGAAWRGWRPGAEGHKATPDKGFSKSARTNDGYPLLYSPLSFLSSPLPLLPSLLFSSSPIIDWSPLTRFDQLPISYSLSPHNPPTLLLLSSSSSSQYYCIIFNSNECTRSTERARERGVQPEGAESHCIAASHTCMLGAF
ncbi:unnamed protein product [Pleuronectes platessa]|uniref:Uncharacterized protein n=1 Tax=Pleuronectes platessa TaxID=8262 RepID=A0A9N7Z055_PLEPL|nr:unnamed protein product [Pleuronectes platessa]